MISRLASVVQEQVILFLDEIVGPWITPDENIGGFGPARLVVVPSVAVRYTTDQEPVSS